MLFLTAKNAEERKETKNLTADYEDFLTAKGR